MRGKIYKAASFFLLRIPIWAKSRIDYSHTKELDSYFEIYLRNEELREAIAIASPTLHQALERKNPKSLNQEAKSLSHYTSRMMVRPTPFGLFSSVSMVEWEDLTNIYFDDRLLKKRTRFDMEWVYLLIQKFYQSNFYSLPVRTNPLLNLSGERFHLDYVRHAEYQKETSSTSFTNSVHSTSLIKLILDYAKKEIIIDELWLKLKSSHPILEQDKTLHVIEQLFSQQFLLPGILPSLLSSTPFNRISHHLSAINGFNKIAQEIKDYNELPFGNGEKALEKLQSDMAALVPNKSYLQVDTAYHGKNLALSKNVLQELEKVLDLLWKISSSGKISTILTTYHSKFLEKYGEYRTIPLLKLLDDEMGLGPSFEDPTFFSFHPDWEKWLNQQWQNCLFQKKKELVFTEESLSPFLSSSQDPRNAPLSTDVLCKIFADSSQDIDLGKFLLVISDITSEGGSIFGRFLDILGNEAQDKMTQFFALEEQLESDSIFLELSSLAESVRGGNLTVRPCLRNYHLDTESYCPSTKEAFSLEDIYVGATQSNFYLTDKESRINFISRANHVYNIKNDPLPLKFMRYVTRSQYTPNPIFSWGSLQDTAVFLPRVSFSKTILSLATWKIEPEVYLKESSEKNVSTFNAWANHWNLPQEFFLVNRDQHLLFNRNKPQHIDEITRKLKNGESLTFVEKIEGAWIKGSHGNHYGEISVPFVKRSEYTKKRNSIKAAPYSEQTNVDRYKFPGGNWLYLKLYMGAEKINDFIFRHLYDFIENFCLEGTIKKWFIVRYGDPESHLRLRIQSQSFEVIGKILSAFEEQFHVWTQSGWIKDVSIGSYERETERYGGPYLIEAAESIFHRDTLSTLFIIHAFLTKQIDCEEIVLHALSIVNFLFNFDLKIDEMLKILSVSPVHEPQLDGFRQHKHVLISLINELQQGRSNKPTPEIQVMDTASTIRLESIQHFCKMSSHTDQSQWTFIIGSLLHMHCNRLGCHNKGEIKAKLYARQALLSILNKESAGLHLPNNHFARK